MMAYACLHACLKFNFPTCLKVKPELDREDFRIICTVIRFFSTSASFGICTVVGLNGTLSEDKMRTF
jgi:hypothetical protein